MQKTACTLPEGWATLEDAAWHLRVSPDSLLQGIRRGEITAYRVFVMPDGSTVYGFKREDLDGRDG